MEHVPIDLAHEPDFAIGSLTVHPSTRELWRDDERLIVEPRVMQVLVALANAAGAVVSKDDLTQRCWNGRVVGEDAINRVMSRLRRLAEQTKAFRIETVTRVGYRLIDEGSAALPLKERQAPPKPVGQTLALSRRALLATLSAGVAFAGGSASLILPRLREPAIPDGLETLLNRAQNALDYYSAEQTASAIGLLKEATRLYPDHAEPWGKLAIAYHQQGWNARRPEATMMLDHAHAAARRALELDRANIDAAVIRDVGLLPTGSWYRNYDVYSRRCANALPRYREHPVAQVTCGAFYFETGRVRRSLETTESLLKNPVSSPQVVAMAGQRYWAAGRPDEAEALFDLGYARWPRHLTLWTSRYRYFIYSRKVHLAEAMLANIGSRPMTLTDPDFELMAAQARAMQSAQPADVAAVLRSYEAVASASRALAENAAIFASANGIVDAAFTFIDLIHGTDDEVEVRPEERLRTHSGRLTYFFFLPPMAPVRADPRFDRLTNRIGLAKLWRESGLRPDYLA